MLAPVSALLLLASAASGQNGWPGSIANEVNGPSWPQFANATQRWSTYAAPTFNEVFIPRTEADLSTGLKYLSRANKTWLAKSGGHGYSVTLESVQDAVLINMGNFNRIAMNGSKVTVGTGATFAELVDAVAAAGRELTVGACPCVGAMGAMLGGGLGRLEGLHGLTSDALLSARVALWDGSIVEASKKKNADLFWGIRGAGQNFGIVFEAVFDTYPATNGGMQYSADLTFGRDKLEAVVNVTNTLLAPELDPALALAISLANDPETLEPVVTVNIVYPGPPDKGRRFRQLYSALSSNYTEQMTAWAKLADVALPGVVLAGCPKGKPHDQYSILTENLSASALASAHDSLSAFARQHPAANGSSIFIETFGQRALKAIPQDSSAFPHRSYFRNAVVFTMTYTDDAVAEAADGWARRMRNTFAQPSVSGYGEWHVYQNYGHGDEPPSALYGYEGWRHERLTRLKNRYDPHGFFDGFHAIPRNLADWS
ncbi:hypothetical protein CDD83_8171 [Cordyceps sp. RAO-2017]|nr:hypothetical protein CDD83_8171 [Cordyceps sp. RAO-2017]